MGDGAPGGCPGALLRGGAASAGKAVHVVELGRKGIKTGWGQVLGERGHRQRKLDEDGPSGVVRSCGCAPCAPDDAREEGRAVARHRVQNIPVGHPFVVYTEEAVNCGGVAVAKNPSYRVWRVVHMANGNDCRVREDNHREGREVTGSRIIGQVFEVEGVKRQAKELGEAFGGEGVKVYARVLVGYLRVPSDALGGEGDLGVFPVASPFCVKLAAGALVENPGAAADQAAIPYPLVVYADVAAVGEALSVPGRDGGRRGGD